MREANLELQREEEAENPYEDERRILLQGYVRICRVRKMRAPLDSIPELPVSTKLSCTLSTRVCDLLWIDETSV